METLFDLDKIYHMSTFKLAHLSDIHAGYKTERQTNAQGINLREADGYIALGQIVTEVIQSEADAAVVCGDTFHIPNPDVRAIIFVQNQLRRLWKAGIPVYMLAGNHDTNDVREDIAASRILHDPARKLYSHVEPYVAHEIAPGINLHMVSHHMYAEQADTMKLIKPVEGEINIFSTHGSCIDPLLKEKLHTEQSPREIVIPDSLFNDYEWNYALLGHIHERGWVGSKDGKSDTSGRKVYYNGSIVRRGFSDKECKLGRGWTLWNISPDGTFKPEHKVVAQRPQTEFKIIDAKDKSPRELSDMIVKNLKASQVNGEEFDSRVAPILRQKLKNIEASKYSSLDWSSIEKNSRHALTWKLIPILDEKISIDSDEEIEENIFDGSDVVKIYDEWTEKSTTLDKVEDNIRELVVDQARGFVELGQEVTLND